MTKILINNKLVLLETESTSLEQIMAQITAETNISSSEYYLLQNGKKIYPHTWISNSNIHMICRLIGGKGGFGSMLRAIGAQIEKTTNREACRDLSGRRLRDINEEKRLKSYLEKKKEEDAVDDSEKVQKKIEKLLSKPKHVFKDAHYEKERSELTEKIDDALEQGFKRASETASASASTSEGCGTKRKLNEEDKKKKKKKKGALWLGADDMSSSSDTETDSDSELSKISTECTKLDK